MRLDGRNVAGAETTTTIDDERGMYMTHIGQTGLSSTD